MAELRPVDPPTRVARIVRGGIRHRKATLALWLLVLVILGTQAAALQQYRACVRVLDRELGVAPLEETTRLYHAIKGDHAPPPPAALAPHPSAREPGEERALPTRDASGTPTAGPADVPAAGLPPYPLVGRAAEWAALGRAYAANLLQQTLEEERAADEKLTRLAERFVNRRAR